MYKRQVYNHTSPDSWLAKNHPEWFYHKPDGCFGNKVGEWLDVIDLDYNNRDLWDYQIETLKMWAGIVDGFRCDVAPLIPLESVSYTHLDVYKRQMLSFISMHKQHWKSSSYAAACGVSDKVLWKTMEGRPFIRNVCICLDNDETGQKAAQRISKALTEKNIRNQILVPTRKDWNEDLLLSLIHI